MKVFIPRQHDTLSILFGINLAKDLQAIHYKTAWDPKAYIILSEVTSNVQFITRKTVIRKQTQVDRLNGQIFTAFGIWVEFQLSCKNIGGGGGKITGIYRPLMQFYFFISYEMWIFVSMIDSRSYANK